MARARETQERIAGAELSGEGSAAARMEGKWEKDTAGTGRDTRALCPSNVPIPACPPGTAQLRAGSQHTRAPGKHPPQTHHWGSSGARPPATRDALGHPHPHVPGNSFDRGSGSSCSLRTRPGALRVGAGHIYPSNLPPHGAGAAAVTAGREAAKAVPG